MVITMVTDTKAVTSIAVDLGMLESLPARAVWAQMSTIGVKGTATVNSSSSVNARTCFSSTRPCREARSPPNKGS